MRILEIHHPWDHYLRYVFSRALDNKLLYEQLIGRRTEFISVLTTQSGSQWVVTFEIGALGKLE